MPMGTVLRRMTPRPAPPVVAVIAVLAAVGALAVALIQVVTADRPAPVSAVVRTSRDVALAVAPPTVEAVAARRPQALLHRAAVGRPSAYPGALRTAPAPTRAAYQRAALIINRASGCGLRWTVLAAVGRVESDHGRGLDKLDHRARADHRVTPAGLVRPALVGRPLNGQLGTSRAPDTDLGKIDRNRRWDAPVGPMGLLPSTWTDVAVDADGDGARRVQDVDDAALAAAVYLCSGVQEGGFEARGRAPRSPVVAGAAAGVRTASDGTLEAALWRYHPGKRFVKTVLALTKRYDRQAAAVPTYPLPPGGVPMPDLPALCACSTPHGARARAERLQESPGTTALPSVREPSRESGSSPSSMPSAPATDTTESPTGDPSTDPTDESACTADPTATPTDEPTDATDPADCAPTGEPTAEQSEVSTGSTTADSTP